VSGNALATCGVWWRSHEKVGNVLIVSASSFVSHVVVLQGCKSWSFRGDRTQ